MNQDKITEFLGSQVSAHDKFINTESKDEDKLEDPCSYCKQFETYTILPNNRKACFGCWHELR
ncbi:hypothetical protein LCGC14_2382430 [marine sediment metagenome]|uniref:Uncharacterized protein n=1 Tax=marine sediment metagenome TaxID=412755 RepID=A0A0F9CMR6_9ZZZZ|nr:hypothetical protein [bacterium]